MVKVYIEGGGNNNSALKTELRHAFQSFFVSSGLIKKPRVVACGSRNDTYDDFRCAINNLSDGDYAILLVDSEGPTNEKPTKAFLEDRDRWVFPIGVTDQHLYLMIESMETWLLADSDALKAYFGHKCNISDIVKLTKLESIPRNDVLNLINKAISDTPSKEYSKGKHSFKVLSHVDGRKVCDLCPQANKLIVKLSSLSQFM